MLGEQNLNRLSGSRVSNSKVISRGNLRAGLPAGVRRMQRPIEQIYRVEQEKKQTVSWLQSRN